MAYTSVYATKAYKKYYSYCKEKTSIIHTSIRERNTKTSKFEYFESNNTAIARIDTEEQIDLMLAGYLEGENAKQLKKLIMDGDYCDFGVKQLIADIFKEKSDLEGLCSQIEIATERDWVLSLIGDWKLGDAWEAIDAVMDLRDKPHPTRPLWRS